MEIKLIRKIRTGKSTIGELYINNQRECFTLEDKDKGLTQKMPLSEITAKKDFGKTAIPSGRYEVALTFSNRFKQYMPLLLNVPGYEGVRIHPGNKAEDTEGCLLLGQTKASDFIGQSKLAYQAFLRQFKAVEKKEKIFITIE